MYNPPLNNSTHRILALGFCAALLFLTSCDSQSPIEDEADGPIALHNAWETAPPADVEMDEVQLREASLAAQNRHRALSLLVVRRGKLVFESYFNGAQSTDLFDVRSVTKSIISTLAGMAVEDGSIPDLDASIAPFVSEFSEQIPASIEQVTIRHLLTMTGGWTYDEWNSSSYTEWISAKDREAWSILLPHPNTPGSVFTYNSAAVHLLGIVVEKSVGMSLEAYASQKLFAPLGITDVEWEMFPSGYPNGGAGIDLHARDLAKIGQLFLQNGMSGAAQVIPSAWIEEATTPKHGSMGTFGPLNGLSYGYLWWTDTFDGNPVYFAWGYGGQFIFVAPHLELVVVTTTNYIGVSSDPGGETALARSMMSVIVNNVVPAAH